MADLLVASGGGHLAQLYRLVNRLPQPSTERTWITFDTPQSRSLLAGQDVRYLPYTGSRAYMQTARNAWTAHGLLREHRYQRVISTGAAPALSFLPITLLHEAEPIYIESAARSRGPSLTGNILSRTPGVRLFTQYEHWADRKWQYAGSVFDGFEAVPGSGSKGVERIVVTLGTIGFGFDRLLKRLIEIIPANVSVLWQVGGTDARQLPIDGIATLSSRELDEEMRRADVVVAHAGIGSALAALDAGRCPVLIPREHAHREHIDDHQRQIAAELDMRGLAIHRSVEDLTYADLERAAGLAVHARSNVPRLRL
ncbi:MAG TPA: glycosyltransferase [Solirubrobacteraceae bacterium]|jgi:UDP-N-acetylglucosamine--N-acetylmuramyl-(pentapeptide) pyrophosphoryl-undecaprenol N-acetylglucosamine transferase|nr:glycosyltransferase [Solirubrobacteraceae bacterium]